MTKYTVMIDDHCGRTIIYQVDAKDAPGAAAYAKYIFDAHCGMAGEVQYVIEGTPVIAGIGAAEHAKTVILDPQMVS